jgi:methanogenic corrinoid protein MtbC1
VTTALEPALSPVTYLDALVAGEPRAAREVLEQLLAAGLDPRRIELEVMQAAMTGIGRLWQEGRVTVAQEHLATAITRSQMAWLAPHLTVPPTMGRTAILAGTPGELHDLGLQMLDDFLTGDGWFVLNLGQAVPADALAHLAAARRPDLVGLSTSLLTSVRGAALTVDLLKQLPERPLVMVGGAAYDGEEALATRIGADTYAVDAGAASAVLRARFDARG